MRFSGWTLAVGLVASPASAAQVASAGPALVRMPIDRSGAAFTDCALRPTHVACAGQGAADILFVDVADPGWTISIASFSLLAADGLATVSAYDPAGRLIGSAGGTGADERVTLVGDIARIAVRPAPHAASMPAGAEPSDVPEPATWAMLLTGFMMIAAGVRRCIRRSERRFDEHIRRIAAGEAR